jgi:hypothetical protein
MPGITASFNCDHFVTVTTNFEPTPPNSSQHREKEEALEDKEYFLIIKGL